MRRRNWRWVAVFVSWLTLIAAGVSTATAGQAAQPTVKHVLLISVDGLHASDVAQCEADNMCPTIAWLAGHGTTYARAKTSEPSDSSPGLMALMTGALPGLTGVYYDDTYDRTMYAPAAQTASGTQNCTGTPGTETQYAENIDTNAPSVANGQVGTRTILNESIDPTQLPYQLENGHCTPVMPNDFLRTNSIFSIAAAAGLRTAWADKHPAADEEVAGHGTPNAVTDPFKTEINADIIPPSLTDTRGNTVTFPIDNPTGTGPLFITDSVSDTASYDQIKVDAVLNEIDGLNSGGTSHAGTPAIYGMNFQTVSVGQKLVDPVLSCVRSGNAPGCDPKYVPGGYEPGTLAFTPQLQRAIASVDAQLGSMVSELKAAGELADTEIILTAKHGQSPIDPSKLALVGHTEDKVLSNAGIDVAQTTDDDVSLLWLKDQSQTGAAVAALKADQAGSNTARIQYILSGPSMTKMFSNPQTDPRTPDIIIQPIPGTIYSTSNAKVMEHGGFSTDDTHVAMIVYNGAAHGAPGGSVIASPVMTTQVAPTVLAALGLNYQELDGVRVQHTRVLPGQ
ncbi:MAG TPA: alkaline phosphatase family protein [Actinomycetota bacterium]|nr:alkaline phosphatase family protein [Actinomycetota bacterium]